MGVTLTFSVQGVGEVKIIKKEWSLGEKSSGILQRVLQLQKFFKKSYFFMNFDGNL